MYCTAVGWVRVRVLKKSEKKCVSQGRRMAPWGFVSGASNYELSSWHVPGLSGLHLRCAGGRLYSPTRIRRRLVVYPGACVMRVPPVLSGPYCTQGVS